MERPLADLTYVVKELPLGPSFPTGQLHDISSGMRTFRPVIDTGQKLRRYATPRQRGRSGALFFG